LLKTPIERSEARSVRAAKAVPIWARKSQALASIARVMMLWLRARG
jgi:hypothetical protein